MRTDSQHSNSSEQTASRRRRGVAAVIAQYIQELAGDTEPAPQA